MKTCTQISDSGFRGKVNVVSPCDSQSEPGRVGGWLFPCKCEVKSSPLGRVSPSKRAVPPPYKHLLTQEQLWHKLGHGHPHLYPCRRHCP